MLQLILGAKQPTFVQFPQMDTSRGWLIWMHLIFVGRARFTLFPVMEVDFLLGVSHRPINRATPYDSMIGGRVERRTRVVFLLKFPASKNSSSLDPVFGSTDARAHPMEEPRRHDGPGTFNTRGLVGVSCRLFGTLWEHPWPVRDPREPFGRE